MVLWCYSQPCMSVTLESSARPTPVLLRAGPAAYLELLVVSAIWGAAFLFNALALQDLSPLEIAFWRLSLASLGLLIVMRLSGHRLPREREVVITLFGIGALNGAIPFVLIAWGQEQVASSVTGILIATSPFATLVIAHFSRHGERFTVRRGLGLVLGFAGVVMLFGGGSLGAADPARMMAICLAAVCYAWSAVLIRRLHRLPNVVIVAGTVVTASVLLLPAWAILHPPWEASASGPAIAAVLALAVGPTGLAYLMRTRLVQRNGPVFMSTAGYLIPLFAVMWGWLFLDEAPGLNTALALLLILVGIAVSQSRSYTQSSTTRTQ